MISTSRNRWITSLWVAIFIYFILTLIISFSYHWAYMSSLTDLGTFDQAVWGTLHSDFFLNTNTVSKKVSYLGIHFRPVLLIFLPFYAILPKAEWMILAQSFALSLTAWPIYLLAKQVTKSDCASLFLGTCLYVESVCYRCTALGFFVRSLLPYHLLPSPFYQLKNPISVYYCYLVCSSCSVRNILGLWSLALEFFGD